MPTSTIDRPLEQTHVHTGCPGVLRQVDDTPDGHCPQCDELLPGVFAPMLAPAVVAARRDLLPHERGYVNAYAHYITRRRRHTQFRGLTP